MKMKIKTITYESRNDFHAIMECEHCGAEQDNKSGYHDNYYHTQVIPGMFCKTCGRNRRGCRLATEDDIAAIRKKTEGNIGTSLAIHTFSPGFVVSSVYTCNGDPRGCERERFGNCTYHDGKP